MKLLHNSALKCHHHGLILTKGYTASTLNYVLCRDTVPTTLESVVTA
jgi:hypothetical protein